MLDILILSNIFDILKAWNIKAMHIMLAQFSR